MNLKFIFLEFALMLLMMVANGASIEQEYLISSSRREPFYFVEEEHILSFDSDIDGDGKPEKFITRGGLQDGKQGYLWTIYSKSEDSLFKRIGEVSFNEAAFASGKWRNDGTKYGFYRFGPAGAGQIGLSFYSVVDGKLVMLDHRKISPDGEGKIEFENIFGKGLAEDRPKVAVSRILVSNISKSEETNKMDMPASGEHRFYNSGEMDSEEPIRKIQEDRNDLFKRSRFNLPVEWIAIIPALLIVAWIIISKLKR